MNQLSCPLFVVVSVFTATAALSECPVTLPSSSPVHPFGEGEGWYGSDALAVRLPSDGKWKGMGPRHNYGDKLWLWRRGYDVMAEIRPDLVLEGARLDGGDPAQRVYINHATSGYGEGWSAMLMGLEFPSAGCWEVTARYTHVEITHDLTFVVEVVNEEAERVSDGSPSTRG
jgi:hypothetical protein